MPQPCTFLSPHSLFLYPLLPPSRPLYPLHPRWHLPEFRGHRPCLAAPSFLLFPSACPVPTASLQGLWSGPGLGTCSFSLFLSHLSGQQQTQRDVISGALACGLQKCQLRPPRCNKENPTVGCSEIYSRAGSQTSGLPKSQGPAALGVSPSWPMWAMAGRLCGAGPALGRGEERKARTRSIPLPHPYTWLCTPRL